eukprot:TRINITY_DN5455_c0_g1_i2.p1 TRINITY_DN5455_c0_g1~~TRINITY_DN5455_c0_g1_i2.p1  ORF type:complete len:2396 (+),score=828.03 TRINITY_DN5455_c0_g1_i2:122-7189(+)
MAGRRQSYFQLHGRRRPTPTRHEVSWRRPSLSDFTLGHPPGRAAGEDEACTETSAGAPAPQQTPAAPALFTPQPTEPAQQEALSDFGECVASQGRQGSDGEKEESEAERPPVIEGAVPSLLTLWRYVGIGGALDQSGAQLGLYEMNRSKLYRALGRPPQTCDWNLRASALGFLPGTNRFRLVLISLLDTVAFDNIVLGTIALNTLTMALQLEAVAFLDLCFLGVFTAEFMLKAMARGFALHRHAYLRSGWNVMDFIIVVAGYTALAADFLGVDGSKLTALRLLRVIRPLRAISRVHGLKVMVQTIAQAMPVLQDVLCLGAFILIVAGVVGVQLWAGAQHDRCYVNLTGEVAGMVPLANDTGGHSARSNATERFCVPDNGQYGYVHSTLPQDGSYYFCTAAGIAAAAANLSGGQPLLTLVRNVSSGCSRSPGVGAQCTYSTTGISQGLPTVCAQDMDQYFTPILNFDNIGSALLLCFKVMSLDDWPLDMLDIQNVSGMSAAAFFICLTLFGNYFTVNLILAVLSAVFGDERSLADGHPDAYDTRPIVRLTPATAVGGATVLPPLFVVFGGEMNPTPDDEAEEDEFSMEEDEENAEDRTSPAAEEKCEDAGHGAADGRGRALSRATGVTMRELEGTRSSHWTHRTPAKAKPRSRPNNCCTKVVAAGWFNHCMTAATVVNVLAMGIDHRGISTDVSNVLETVNQVCSAIFLVEAVIKLIGMGAGQYFSSPFNTFDFCLVVVSVLETAADLAQGGGGGGGSPFSALRAFRLLRVFRLASNVDSLRQLLVAIVRSVKSVLYLGFLMVLFVLVYALFGLTLFDTPNSGGYYAGSRENFANLGQAAITVFIITTGEGWATMMLNVMQGFDKSRWVVALYFISAFVIGNYLLTNLFVAILIDTFSRVASAADKEELVNVSDFICVKAETLAASMGAELTGRTFVEVSQGGPAAAAGVQERRWLVTAVDGAPVVTVAEMEAVFAEGHGHVRVQAQRRVPRVVVLGAVDSAGHQHHPVDGVYAEIGEVGGRPSYRKPYTPECLPWCRRREECVLFFDEAVSRWALEGHGVRISNEGPEGGAEGGAEEQVPAEGWPAGMVVRRVRETGSVDFQCYRPIAQHVFVFDAIITTRCVLPFVRVDYKPEYTVWQVKQTVCRRLQPLRQLPPRRQRIRVAAAGEQSAELGNEVRLGQVFEGTARPLGAELLRPAPSGQRQPPVEDCLWLDYDVLDMHRARVEYAGRVLQVAVARMDTGEDMLTAIARRVMCSRDRLRLYERESMAEVQLTYDGIAPYHGKRSGPPPLLLVVLPMPSFLGMEVSFVPPEFGSAVSGTVAEEDLDSVTVRWDTGEEFEGCSSVMARWYWEFESEADYGEEVTAEVEPRGAMTFSMPGCDATWRVRTATWLRCSPVHPRAAVPPEVAVEPLQLAELAEEPAPVWVGKPEPGPAPVHPIVAEEMLALMPGGYSAGGKAPPAPGDGPWGFSDLEESDLNPFRDGLMNMLDEETAAAEAERADMRGRVRGKSFCVFGADGKFRRLAARVDQHALFDHMVTVVIAVNTLFLALDHPGIKEDAPTTAHVLSIGDYVFTGVFFFEFAVRAIARGFWFGAGAYMKDYWCRFDLFIVMVSFLGIFVDAVKPARVLRSVRLLLRLPRVGEEQRMALLALLKAIPQLGQVCLICALMASIFGILGVQLFKGALGQCNDPAVSRKELCVGQFNGSAPSVFGPEWAAREREWSDPDYSFDNVFAAIRALSFVAIGETWAAMMFAAMDSQGEDQGPARDGNPLAAGYFILFVIVGQFFLLNLFVGVLIDGFLKEKDVAQGKHLLTPEQQDYLVYENIIFRTGIQARQEAATGMMGIRECCFVLITAQSRGGNVYFELGISALIILNTVMLSTYHYRQGGFWDTAQDTADWFFIAVFTVELVLKIFALSIKQYLADPWNRFDMIVVAISWLGKLLQSEAMAVMRIVRFLRIINLSPRLLVLFQTLMQSMEALLNVTFFLLTIMFFFAVFGVQLCGTVDHNDGLHDYLNFDNVAQAMVTLYVIATTEGWLDVMEGCKGIPSDFRCRSPNCGGQPDLIVELYFITYMVLVSLVTINLFVSALLENFNNISREEELKSKMAPLLGIGLPMPSFTEMWLDEDPRASQLLPCNKFFAILKLMGTPYWRSARWYGRADLSALLQLRRLPIPVQRLGQGGTVRWQDCIGALAMVLAGMVTNEGVTVGNGVLGSRLYRAQRRCVLSIHHWFAVNLIQKHWIFKKKGELARVLLRRVTDVGSSAAACNLRDRIGEKGSEASADASSEEDAEDCGLLDSEASSQRVQGRIASFVHQRQKKLAAGRRTGSRVSRCDTSGRMNGAPAHRAAPPASSDPAA